MQVLIASSEVVPFAKTGGLADVAGALPLALAREGVQASIILPCYQGMEKKWSPKDTGVRAQVPILIGDQVVEKQGQILETRLNDAVPVYFVKCDEYYDRPTLYGTPEGDFPDNAARFTFFSRATLQFLKARGLKPDVIHCHDWQSALIPVYLKTLLKDDPLLGGVKTVFTVHNLGYQGSFWKWDMKLIGLDWEWFTPDYLEFYGQVNFLKGGLLFSDLINTVSKGYAKEIQTAEYGCGLEGVLQSRQKDLFGLLNGIDYTIWNPATDSKLAATYSAKNLKGKAACKRELQKRFGLPEEPRAPLVGCISRLADQKGFDLIERAFDQMMAAGVQFVLLGTGEKHYHALFEDLARRYPKQAGIKIAYDDTLAHQIEAGADFFLMPSLYEPCGLNQMISLKYGTIPVVRATGGLDDTIQNYSPRAGKGNGFKFKEYSSVAMLKKLLEAVKLYQKNPKAWERLVKKAMQEDHSWAAAAKQYLDFYQRALSKKAEA